jgi:hypothetical protein
VTPAGSLTLRLAGDDDARELRALAGRDSAPELTGTILAAELDGAILAAASLEQERVIADPFQPTAELVEVLRLRLCQLRGTAPGTGYSVAPSRPTASRVPRPMLSPKASDSRALVMGQRYFRFPRRSSV